MKLAANTWPGYAIVFALSLALAGCSDKKRDEQPAQPEPAPQAAPRPADAPPNPAATPTKPPEPVRPEAVPQRPKQEPSPSPAAEPPTIVPEAKKPAPKEEPKPPPTSEPARPGPPAPPAPPAAPQKPSPEPKKVLPSDVVVMTGSPMGGVRLAHRLHAQRAGNTCTTCHHASKPEKPATAPQQACSDCHTKVAAAPMKTKYQAAFHNPTAQSGTCIDCHRAEAAKGKKTPLKCTECHKKENK